MVVREKVCGVGGNGCRWVGGDINGWGGSVVPFPTSGIGGEECGGVG